MSSNPSFTKRQKEKNRKEKQMDKDAKRAERRREKAARPKGSGPEMDTVNETMAEAAALANDPKP